MLEISNFELYNHSEIILSIDELNINSGDFVYICGNNRSGKSLLLSCFAGEYKKFKGSLTLKGKALSDNNYKDKIRYIKNEAAIFPDENLEHNLLISVKERLQNKSIEENYPALMKLKLPLEKNIPCSLLSCSELKLIEIARAYIQKPYMLLIDDLDNYFDSEYFESVYAMISQLKQKGTLIIASGKSLIQNEKQYILADKKLEIR